MTKPCPKEENLKTLKTAKGGLDAVTEALTVLKVFYKQAAKASALVQVYSTVECHADSYLLPWKGEFFDGHFKMLIDDKENSRTPQRPHRTPQPN